MTSDAEDLQTKKAQRLLVLERAYRLSRGESGREFFQKDLEEEAGPRLSPETIDSAVSFLDAEGLLRFVAFGGVLELTHAGVKEYERATTHPDQPTRYFPPISIVQNVLHVGKMEHSQTQQGTVGSSHQQNVTGVDSAAILSLVREIRTELERIQAPATTRAEIETDLQTIELQARAAKPKWRIVRESLLSARAIVENLIASEIFAKLQALLGGLPN